MEHNDIVVGTDGGAGGAWAVRWAASQAARTGARLRVVSVHHRQPGTPTGPDVSGRERAWAVVTAAVADARGGRPTLDVRGSALPGAPGDVLLAETRSAALLVVGSQGRGALASALLGSVGVHVATYATGPVVVVRGRADTAIGTVVAGIADPASAERVLAAGFEEAHRRGCALVAVHAPTPPRTPAEAPSAGLGTLVRADVSETVTRLRTLFPTVPVEVELTTGNPADVLVAASRSAQLVVLDAGSAPSLDPVNHHLLLRADCPVLLLRDTL
ncbi:universal stress protein [Dactylosporangium sp. NPDC006015]|uniref:universal stress protein n=1 Tax=Dactylosporangium sp. NPDC006015 TaxID=3154576 RepID=UPI0033B9212F